MKSQTLSIETDNQTLSKEIRLLAEKQNAVILAHNYQVPEIQEVADFVGDSLQLSRQAAATDRELIAFCGVHFMAETASVLSPDKTVIIPDLAAGCSLADSITVDDLTAWKARYPEAVVVMYVNTSAQIKAMTDYCVTSPNAVAIVKHIWETRGPETDILFGPDIWLGGFVARELGVPDDPQKAKRFHVFSGECHVHAGIRPEDIDEMRNKNKNAEFLVHPECGCSTQIMEYVASDEIDTAGLHMLSTGQMLDHVRKNPTGDYIVATETGMLYGLGKAAPEATFQAANPCAICPFMKMSTLEKLRNSLRDIKFEVKVDKDTAALARIPIERMVSIG